MFKNRVDAGKRLAQVVEVSQGNQAVVLLCRVVGYRWRLKWRGIMRRP